MVFIFEIVEKKNQKKVITAHNERKLGETPILESIHKAIFEPHSFISALSHHTAEGGNINRLNIYVKQNT